MGELVSAPIAVEPAQIVEVSTELECDQEAGLRPFGRVVLRFLDEQGEVRGEVSRMALLWPRGTPTSEPSVLQLATLVPGEARTLEVRLGLADGTHTGDRITFRLPRLWLR